MYLFPYLAAMVFVEGCGCGGSTILTGDAGGDPTVDVQVDVQVDDAIEVAPVRYWSRTYGWSGHDRGVIIENTFDGEFIAAANTSSGILIFKLDPGGNVLWAKAYGSGGGGTVEHILQLPEGGYIVSGITSGDIWVIMLEEDGNVQWQKKYSGEGRAFVCNTLETSDGGFIVAGSNESFDSDYYDIVVIRIDVNGDILWQKSYGGQDTDVGSGICEAPDGGFIVAGITWSFGAGERDLLVLRLDANGEVLWQKTYGESNTEISEKIIRTSDNAVVIAAINYSSGGGLGSYWVLKLDLHGNVMWQKIYNGGHRDELYDIQETSDGGYILAGGTQSYSEQYADAWIIKLDDSGNSVWQKVYGEQYYDRVDAIRETADGGFIAVGQTISFGLVNFDTWVLKIDPNGGISETCPGGMIRSSSAELIVPLITPVDAFVTTSTTHAAAVETVMSPEDVSIETRIQCGR